MLHFIRPSYLGVLVVIDNFVGRASDCDTRKRYNRVLQAAG